MEKLERFVAGRTLGVIRMDNQNQMRQFFDAAAAFTRKKVQKKKNSRRGTALPNRL